MSSRAGSEFDHNEKAVRSRADARFSTSGAIRVRRGMMHGERGHSMATAFAPRRKISLAGMAMQFKWQMRQTGLQLHLRTERASKGDKETHDGERETRVCASVFGRQSGSRCWN